MTLDRRRLIAIIASRQGSVEGVPPPGEGPPPPAPEPGGGTAPTVKTLAATGVTTTAATLNGDLLSLGSVDSETPRTIVNVWFQYRVVGAGTLLGTTPVAQVAPEPFNLGLTDLTPATAYETRAAVTSEAGTVFGNLLAFTSDEVTDPGQPSDNFLDLTAGATYALTASNGTVTGIAGAWEVAGDNPLRQGGVESLIVGDLVPSLGVRNKRYVIENADLTLAATFTLLLVAQRRALASPPWMTVLERNDGNNQIGGISCSWKNDGGARFNVRQATSGSLTAIDLPAGTIVDGDRVAMFVSVGAAGMRLRVNGAAAVVNGAVTSIGTGISSRMILGTGQTGASPWNVALAGMWVWDGAQLTAGQEDAIIAQLKARIRWAPPLTFEGEVGEQLFASPASRSFMASATPTIAITVQPGNGDAEVDGQDIIVVPTAAGTNADGRYTLTDGNGTPLPTVMTVVATQPETPPVTEIVRSGVARSGPITLTTDPVVAAWEDSFTAPAGHLIVVFAADRNGVATPPTSAGYAEAAWNPTSLTLSAWRHSGVFLYKVAGGGEPSTIPVAYAAESAAHVVAMAFEPPAGYVFTGAVVASAVANTGSEDGKASLALSIPAGLALVVSAWSGRHTEGTLEPQNMRLDVGDDPLTFAANSADGIRRLRGAMDHSFVGGPQTFQQAVRHDPPSPPEAAMPTLLNVAAIELAEEGASSNVTFEDTFATLSLNDYGLGGVNWGAHFLGWGVRYLQGNSDQAWKGGPNYRGAGGSTLAELGLACHEIVNGNLKLYGIQTPAEHRPQFYGFPYLGGMISSQNRHSQTYGIIECRAKFFASFGHHWAMWLVAADNSWPPEIDMVEILREDGNSYADNRLFINRHLPAGVTANVTMHNGAIGFADGLPPYYPVANNAALADWHDYKFVWTPDVMEWHIDGLIRMSCPNYVNKPMYFLISPEIGGSWPKPTTANTIWPMEAEIEYVRWSNN